MRFKVGDKVRVREDLEVWENYEPVTLLSGGMADTRGNVYRVLETHSVGVYTLSNEFLYAEEMLEPIEDPLAAKIEERNNKPYTSPNTGDPWIDNLPEEYYEMYEEEDAVKPTHYQNNGKDLFEEWFERYNDNGKIYTGKEVFIEIMKSVAERYIRRYPNKGKYDLEKGIYTLERLKEYEEVQHERATDSQR